MDFAYWDQLLTALEAKPDDLQLYHGELETMITECMQRVLVLAKQGDFDDEEMQVVSLESSGSFGLDRGLRPDKWERSGDTYFKRR